MPFIRITTLAATATLAIASGAAAQSWEGGYVGGSIGGIFLGNESDEISFDTDLDGDFGDTIGVPGNAFSPGFCDGIARGNEPEDGCDDDETSSLSFSLRAGFDRQFGNLVVGGIGEITGAEIEDVTTAFSTTPAFYSITREMDYMAAARGRIGFASGMTLGYVTGGIAFADIDYGFRTSNNPNTFTIDEDISDVGFQLGGGVEKMITERFSVGVEYLYTRFEDDSTVRASDGGNVFVAENPDGTDFTLGDDFETHTLSVTASIRF